MFCVQYTTRATMIYLFRITPACTANRDAGRDNGLLGEQINIEDVMKFLKEFWKQLTGRMQPWVKWSFGVVAFPVCLVALPIAVVAIMPPVAVTFMIGRITKTKWFKKLEALIIKPVA